MRLYDATWRGGSQEWPYVKVHKMRLCELHRDELVEAIKVADLLELEEVIAGEGETPGCEACVFTGGRRGRHE